MLKVKFAICLLLLISVAAVGELAPDPRLDRKVTYKAKGELLSRVIKDLTKETRIAMKCGKNNADWQVRDRKITVFVHDMPLKDLQKSISDIMHFSWVQSEKDGAITYRLIQTREQKQEESRLFNAAESIEPEKRRKAIAEVEKLSNLSAAELEELRKKSPWLYFLAKDPDGQVLGQIINAIPEVKQALIDRRKVRIPISKLSPEAAAAATSFAEGCGRLENRFEPDGNFDASTNTPEYDISDAEIVVNAGLSKRDDEYLGIVTVEGSGADLERSFPMVDPNSGFAKVFGRVANGNCSQDQLDVAITQTLSEEKNDRQVQASPDDPDIEKEIKLDASGCELLPEILEKLAAKSGLQIISDDFRQTPQKVVSQGKLLDILGDISSNFEKQVKKDGNTLLLVDQKWPVKRSWEIPEKKLEYWRKRAESYTLTLQDLVDIAMLTDDQQDETISNDDALVRTYSDGDNREFLRFYAVLTADQITSASNKTGLSLTELSDDQYSKLQNALMDSSSAVMINRSRSDMRLFQVTSGDGFVYAFWLGEAPTNREVSDDETFIGGRLASWTYMLPAPDVASGYEHEVPSADNPSSGGGNVDGSEYADN